ncbi:MAG: DMT family transporter [Desulfonauticus sp.]|nr:DMT family transporter [Desulfonauticus sp.]
MQQQALFFIILSALFHLGWNFCVKKSPQKQLFIWSIFGATLLLFLPLVVYHWSLWKHMPFSAVIFCLVASFMYSFYQLCLGKAYQNGELSLVYPLTGLSPLFVPIWANWFLGETLTFSGFVGVFLITFGATLLQWQPSNLPFSKERSHKTSVLWALAASVFASVGSVFDKAGVDQLSGTFIYFYITLMVFFMFCFLTVFFRKEISLDEVWMEVKEFYLLIFWGGLFLAGSVLFFRYGMKFCSISYAVALRKASMVLGVWIGAVLYKESYVVLRTLASIIIVLGIFLLK